MAEINPDNLPWNYLYVTDGSDFVTDGTAFVIDGSFPFPPAPPHNGSNGNGLLCTSYIVDMGFPRSPDGVERSEPSGPTRDSKGRPVRFD